MNEKFAFITDLHLDDKISWEAGAHPRDNFEMILKDLERRNIQTVILGGDLGEAESLPWLFEKLKSYELFVLLGNHDHYYDVKKHWQGGGQPDGMYYSFSRFARHFICMDSSSEKISDEQMNWLKSELSKGTNLLLFIHHPVVPVGSIVDVKYPLKGREALLTLIKSYNKRIHIFCGHCHAYHENKDQNIQQITAPSVSFQVEGETSMEFITNAYGYCVVQVNDENVNTEVVHFNTD